MATNKLTAATEKKLVAALLANEMIAREICDVTGWDREHFSVKNGVNAVANRAGLKVKMATKRWMVPNKNGIESAVALKTYRLVKAEAKKAAKAAA